MVFGRVILLAVVACCAPGVWAQAADRVVAYEIVNGREIPDSLTGRLGDWRLGRSVYFNRDLAGCSGCHGSPGGPGAQPDIDARPAPGLQGIALRMEPGVMRLWLIAPEVIDEDFAFHTYYSVGQRDDPKDPRYGETRLTAAEIEGLVAYLMRQIED